MVGCGLKCFFRIFCFVVFLARKNLVLSVNKSFSIVVFKRFWRVDGALRCFFSVLSKVFQGCSRVFLRSSDFVSIFSLTWILL